MKAEHLKAWLQAATREKDQDITNVGKIGKCNTGRVLGRIHSGGLDVDNHGPDTKG